MDARTVKKRALLAAGLCAFLCAVFLAGCAAGILPGTLGTASTALSLGSLGQTLINATYVDSGNNKVAVAPLPANYKNNLERMIREAWEQNYQFVKGTRWEDEDIPWKDLAKTALRKGRGDSSILVLVEKAPLKQLTFSEEKTFYTTVSGRLIREPAEAAGESYYPHARAQKHTVTIYTYSAYFFTRSRQPSGLLLSATPKAGPCGPGIAVRAVGKKTPGEKAGIRAGDVITHVNERVPTSQTFFSLLVPGTNPVRICRNGALSTHTLEIPTPARTSAF